MIIEKENIQDIKQAFFQYAKEHELSNLNTTSYYARQFLPEESFFLKRDVINSLIESGTMIMKGKRWVIRE